MSNILPGRHVDVIRRHHGNKPYIDFLVCMLNNNGKITTFRAEDWQQLKKFTDALEALFGIPFMPWYYFHFNLDFDSINLDSTLQLSKTLINHKSGNILCMLDAWCIQVSLSIMYSIYLIRFICTWHKIVYCLA